MIAGRSDGGYRYFENVGNADSAIFASVQSNPFGLDEILTYNTPTLVDLDGDGDLDLVSGKKGSVGSWGSVNNRFHFYENICVFPCINTVIYLDASGEAQLSESELHNIHCSPDNIWASQTSFTCDDVGDVDVVITAVVGSDTLTCTSVVTVADSSYPVISCVDAEITLSAQDDVVLNISDVSGGVTAICPSSINLVVNPSAFDCYDVGTHVVTLSATSSVGDMESCEATVTVAAHENSTQRAFKYQAVIRDSLGVLLPDQAISLKASIIPDSTNGTAVYEEVHALTTNEFALVTTNIGSGTAMIGCHGGVDWGEGNYYLKIEMDENGGSDFAELSTTQLLSVPYALFAENVRNDADEQELAFSDGQLSIENANTVSLEELLDNTDEQTLALSNDELSIENGNSVDLSAYSNTDEQDLSLSGTTLSITNGNSADLSSLTDNLGDHTATENIQLNENWLSHDGDDEGVYVDTNGYVGIGTSTPSQQFTIAHSDEPVFRLDREGNKWDWEIYSTTGGDLNFRGGSNNIDSLLTDMVTFEGTGNVGIGTKSPSAKLTVVGTIESTTGGFKFPDGTTQTSATIDTDTDEQDLSFSGTTLSITNGNSADLSSLQDNLGDHTAIQNIQLDGNWLSNDGGNEGIYINTDGEVGIGISSPTQPLQVNGDMHIGGGSSDYDGTSELIQIDGRSDTWYICVQNETSTSASDFFIGQSGIEDGIFHIENDGNVGIGTRFPDAQLEVAGDLKIDGGNIALEDGWISNDGDDEGLRFNNAGEVGVNQVYSNVSFNVRGKTDDNRIMRVEKHDGTNVVTVDSTGNVGIGIVSATQKLHVVGNICYTGSSSSCSDLRYKKDITVLPNVLEKLEQINGVSYYWKTQNFPEKGFEDKKQIGVIAQELELVYPELVITDANGYKTVDYPKLTAVLIEAVKTQYSKTQIVEVENRELKERVGSYESRLQKIEAVLNFQDKTER